MHAFNLIHVKWKRMYVSLASAAAEVSGAARPGESPTTSRGYKKREREREVVQ